jgi:hypothetical protein
MELLDTLTVEHASGRRHIKLYHGDLASIPASEAVDLLIVSAFPDDYVPTPTSLIGALRRKGISVAELARDKEVDLRDAFSSWLSRDIGDEHPAAGFRRILCFEPARRGQAAEVVGDVFRAIMPIALGDPPVRSIAMPLLASGDQNQDPSVMLAALLDAALHWLARGLPVEVIKVVVYSAEDAETARALFARIKSRYTARPYRGALPRVAHATRSIDRELHVEYAAYDADDDAETEAEPYDCFISYAREDEAEVQALVRTLKEVKPDARIFLDRLEINLGDSWQAEIDEALEGCRKVIAVYSPAYLQSKVCIEEFNMARLRHRENGGGVLVPIYLRTVDPRLPLYMRSLNYVDCREGDPGRIDSACRGVVAKTLAG